MVRKRACVFISGSGTNLRSIIKNSRDYNFPINISLVVSNNRYAKGIFYAKKFSIPYICINSKRQKFEKIILNQLIKKKIKLICLAGFMRILSKKFIRDFKGKIINIHPSLLPKYKGLNTHRRAIKNKDKFSGATVHFVTPKLDSGKIILQKKVKISKIETENTLAKKVLKIEHKIYPAAIEKFLKTLVFKEKV